MQNGLSTKANRLLTIVQATYVWSSYRTPSVSLTQTHPSTFNTVRFQAPERSANHQHAPTPRNPIPMDIDASWKTQPLGKAGHKAPDCPTQFDIRELSIDVTTFFLLLLLLWTFELYLILSRRSYLGDLISWSTILSLDLRSYLDLLIISSDDDPRYVSLYELYIITYMHSTCLWLMSFIDDRHAFYTCCCATCFYLTLDMLWTHILHVFTLRTTHAH